jgi:hypothetical protein
MRENQLKNSAELVEIWVSSSLSLLHTIDFALNDEFGEVSTEKATFADVK